MISLRLIGPFVDEPSSPPGRQHLKSAGPGQRPDTVFPLEHCETHWQLPPEEQEGLVQHLMSLGVPGQAPVM